MELAVDNLACRRGDVTVLDGVTLRVPAGGALILRGPNGVGKTTLLRTLAGLTPPLRGRIAPGHEAMVYAAHADGLKAQLTASENLAFWAAVYGKIGDVDAALATFGLSALGTRPAQYLSAGQKRRLGLARLLVAGRPLWLLDEPTVSLDQDSVRNFAGVVAGHCAAGGIAVIATHVDLGLEAAATLDLSPFRAAPGTDASPFLDAGAL